ncbi:putative LRR receptor-like serine/threonine-protein kinase-like [Capsicum annuum]|nr:putative LRR receptor-like serine/threonine-protein kinase-like [Capsicum annuum]
MQLLYLCKNRLNQLTSNPLCVFPGEIPKEISNLIELEELYLPYNRFSGSLDMEIFNISRLTVISLSVNSLSGTLPPNMCSVIPNIEELYLRNLTNLVGTIPHSISNCSKLTILELSGNKLTGLIPNSLGYLTHLQLVNLEGNNLTSDSSLSFLTSLTYCRNLKLLFLSLNTLNGMLPAATGNLSTSLRKFYAKNCKIKGRIPNEVGNFSSLLDLHLSGNNLVGSIPTSIGNLRNLQRFNLSDNKLTGLIGDHVCKLQHLGSLPPKIGNLKVATLIDLSVNQFSNEIPREIGGLQTLAYLSLRHNKLEGAIADSMSNMYFNVSVNKLYDEIPLGGPLKNLLSLFFIYNEALCGSSRFSVLPCPTSSKNRSNRKKLLVLFLLLVIAVVFVTMAFVLLWTRYGRGKSALQQAESFSTVFSEVELPLQLKCSTCNWMQHSRECEVLCSLRHRNLVKVITSCSNLHFKALVLEYMPNGSLEKYLYSHNYFLDTKQRLRIMIDVACASLPEAVMDVVDVNLVTPMGNHLQKELDVVASIMKVALDCCAESPARRTNMKDVVGMLQKIEIQLLAFLNLMELAEFRTLSELTVSDSPYILKNYLSSFIETDTETVGKLTILDLSYNKLTGLIPISLGYLTHLREIHLGSNELSSTIPPSIGNLQDLVVLDLSSNNMVGSLPPEIGNQKAALVLEYMPNGSLEKYLYSHNYFLDTKQRLSIMIDVACALEYLHHGCSSPMIHCDLKPSNILLDEDMVAHLSNFGISKLLGEDQGDLYTKTLATLGYIAPEYGMDGLVSRKCDVYSYGIMLLETFTRRKPNEFEGDLSLKQWVSYSLPKAVMDVVDANLVAAIGKGLQKELDVVASILTVALDCCAESPVRRTNMKDVVAMLQKIKIQLLEH